MSTNGVPDDRCGNTKDNSAFSGPPGSVTCWRETWRDGSCIWHANNEDKPISELVASRTEHPERLDKATLRDLDLRDAISFKECNLNDADFTHSNLVGSDFSGAELANANFSHANLPGADLSRAHLNATIFRGANLTNARISGAKIGSSTDFDDLGINEGTDFEGKSGWETDADDAAELHSWLAQKVPLLFRALGRHHSNPRDLKFAKQQYRRIQRLMRNHDLPEKPSFQVRIKHARRKQALAEGRFLAWFKLAFYRWVLGYGEKPRNVVGTSIAVIGICAGLFPVLGGTQPPLESLEDQIYFSITTFTTLGYGDFKPATAAARNLASIEASLGVLLTAFLVFVLGRRVTF